MQNLIASIHWIGLKETLPKSVVDKVSFLDYIESSVVVDYFGSYRGFLEYSKALYPDTITVFKNVVIVDKGYYASKIKGDINFVDISFDPNNLVVHPIPYDKELFIIKLKDKAPTSSTLHPLDKFRNYYKEVLNTYNRITFFDHFSTFKYIINKELRKELEDGVYKYFAGLINIETFRELFSSVEKQLKASQTIKYVKVKEYINSPRIEVLSTLVNEPDQEKVKVALDKHSLDYFDVNYIKAYLRDYGKTKEEKGKKKVQVQNVLFEGQEDSFEQSIEEASLND